MNTLVPAPVGEANRDGKIAFDLGRVPANTKHVFFLHLQVNPTQIGRRSQDVELYETSSSRVTQNDLSVTGALLVGGTIALMTVAVSYTSFRFPRLRPILEGEPEIVVQDGKPIERNLSRNRITLEELAAAARLDQLRAEALGSIVCRASAIVSFPIALITSGRSSRRAR